MYKCLYNYEFAMPFLTRTPYQDYTENVKQAQIEGLVNEVGGTQVDAIMCCPTAWRLPLYYSEVNRIWQEQAPLHKDPLPEDDWKFFDKVFSRIKRYMLGENYADPVQIGLEATRKNGMAFFISYRMNDFHYTYYTGKHKCPTMDPLWQDHPEYRIGDGAGHFVMNYMIPEVRAWYFNILRELAEKYDIDGMELDFMRHNYFFRPEEVEKGRGVMTGFVREIRSLLNALAAKRGKPLRLCVRVPRNLKLCDVVGLDVVAWDQEGLIDMLNASTHFRNSPEIDIEGFKSKIPRASLYAEMHFALGGAKLRHRLNSNVNRRTTGRMYETTAFGFLDRGADGLSLFNFPYTRDHQLNDPRRRMIQDAEPPFGILRHILDRDYLEQREKHYTIVPGFDLLPRNIPAPAPLEFDIYIADRFEKWIFEEAVLRLELEIEKYFIAEALDLYWNDVQLERIPGSGELFRPLSQEALPMPEELLFYNVPPDCLKHGNNKLKIVGKTTDEFFYVTLCHTLLTGIELALYKHKRD